MVMHLSLPDEGVALRRIDIKFPIPNTASHSSVHKTTNSLISAPQELGADLVSVETSGENECIKHVVDVSDKDMSYSYDHWILGAKRRSAKDTFIWEQTRAPVIFADWVYRYGPQPKGNYLRMNPRHNRKWDSLDLGSNSNIICEGTASRTNTIVRQCFERYPLIKKERKFMFIIQRLWIW